MFDKKILVLLIILVFLLILSICGLGYIVFQKIQQNEIDKIALEKKEQIVKKNTIYNHTIKNLVFQIVDHNNSPKNVYLTFTLSSNNSSISNQSQENYAEIIDTILNLISLRNSSELQTLRGKEIFIDEINEALTAIFSESINIKFNNFYIKPLI